MALSELGPIEPACARIATMAAQVMGAARAEVVLFVGARAVRPDGAAPDGSDELAVATVDDADEMSDASRACVRAVPPRAAGTGCAAPAA